MRTNLLYLLTLLGGALLVRNLYQIFMVVPDEAAQGAVFRIFYMHVPAAFVAATMGTVAFVASILYLIRRNLRFDALAAAATEVLVVFAVTNLITGMLWARPIWGIWWAWDARLTSMLVFTLMYGGYLMMRGAIPDPTTRAKNCAALSVFTFPGVMIVWKSIQWFRTQHPGPVLTVRQGGGMAPGMEAPMWWNFLALLMLATVLLIVRTHQQQVRRELDAMRQAAYAE